MARGALPARVAAESAARNAARLNVFISYSRQDIVFVDRLQAALAERSIEAFVDRDHIEKGEEWWARIMQLITNADTIVFVLSPGSVDSAVCKDEVAYAEKLNKRFVPIVARDLEGRAVPDALARLNYIFFIPNPAGASGDFDAAVADLVRALEADIPWIREHTRLGALAERWEARQRPGDLLLRGAELNTAETWLTTRPEEAPDPTDSHHALVTLSRQAATRRQRTLVAASLAAVLVAISLAGTAMWQREVAAKNEGRAALEAQRAEAEAQRAIKSEAQTRATTDLAQINESGALASAASKLTDDYLGKDAGTAMLLALEGLPDASSNVPNRRERQYASEAEFQLDRSLGNLRERVVLSGHTDLIWRAAFSSNGQRVVTVSKDNTVRIWDAATGKELRRLLRLDRDSDNSDAVFSPDGSRLATTSSDDKNAVRIWDTNKGTVIARLTGKKIAFNSSGSRAVTVSQNNIARVWDVASSKEIAVVQHQESFAFDGPAISGDGLRVATLSDTKTVRVWDLETRTEIGRLKGHTESVTSAVFSPDGTRVATTSEDNTVRTWNAKGGKQIARLVGHCATGNTDGFFRCEVTSAAFSTDGARVVTASFDRTARVWDGLTGQEIHRLEGHTGHVTTAAFSGDGEQVVTASDDDTARLWNARTGREIARLEGHTGSVLAAAFSSDGTQVVTASSDGTGRVWNAAVSRELGRLAGASRIVSAAFSRDGTRVVSISADRAVQMWDAKTGTELVNLPGRPPDMAASTKLSPDGRRRVSDGAVWDVATGKKVASLRPWHDAVNTGLDHAKGAVFSPDGTRVVTFAGDDAAVWRVFRSTDELVQVAKSRAPRCLPRESRREYGMPEAPPTWCVERRLWPYHTDAWQSWLPKRNAWLATREGPEPELPAETER